MKSRSFEDYRTWGNLEMTVDTFNKRRVDELIIIDSSASKNKTPELNTFVLNVLSRNCLMPVSFGGGIQTLKDIEACLKHGCDKVIINTIVLKKPEFLKDAVRCFGSQCIIVSVDYKMDKNNKPILFSHCKYKEHQLDFIEYIKLINSYEAGEVFLTNVDKEGWMKGLDIDIVSYVRKYLDMPILLHGGVGNPEHIYEGINSGADAVCAGSIFPFSQYGYRDIKEYLKLKKNPVRLGDDPFF